MAGVFRSSQAVAVAICCFVLTAQAASSQDEMSAPTGPSSGVPSAAAGGTSDSSVAAAGKARMAGEWRLIAIDRTQLSRGGTPTVVFGDEGHCWGSTGVNDFRTTFNLQDPNFGRLKVGNAAVTRKMGPPEAMALEKLFLDRLESAISYEVSGDLLYLHSGDDQNLTFERVYAQ